MVHGCWIARQCCFISLADVHFRLVRLSNLISVMILWDLVSSVNGTYIMALHSWSICLVSVWSVSCPWHWSAIYLVSCVLLLDCSYNRIDARHANSITAWIIQGCILSCIYEQCRPNLASFRVPIRSRHNKASKLVSPRKFRKHLMYQIWSKYWKNFCYCYMQC
jgi:hypothetical protein